MFFLRLQLQHIKDSRFFFLHCQILLLLAVALAKLLLFFFFFLLKVKTQFFVHDAMAALSAPERDVRNHWWCPVFIFRVDLPSVLCFREEAVSHGKTNVRELPKAPPPMEWRDPHISWLLCGIWTSLSPPRYHDPAGKHPAGWAVIYRAARPCCGSFWGLNYLAPLTFWITNRFVKCAEDLQQYHLIIEAEASSISRVCGGIFVARLPCERRCARHRCGLRFKLGFLNSYY